MKDFLKYMLASMLGMVLVVLIVFFISLGLLMGLISAAEKQQVKMSENTILKIEFEDPIPERTPRNDFLELFTGGVMETSLGLNDIVKNLERAKDDDRIRGIMLNLDIVPSGIATLEEVRAALMDFKESGKPVYYYGEYVSQTAYYLGSVADKMYIHPQGFIDFKGLNARLMFLKGMFDKLDIDMQIVRHGKFKSAVEPLIREEMSPESREQYSRFIGTIWKSMLEQISASRNLGEDELNSLADELVSFDAAAAVEARLIDETVHRDEYKQELAAKFEVEEYSDLTVVSLSDYSKTDMVFPVTADRIAVIYATGTIGGGEGNNEMVGSDKFARTIAKARKDEDVKAVVLRVNSPGGDALASDVIWRELKLTQEEKPVIVSMGDLAASGGYWISSASDHIMADPTSLTGSIGVFGVVPDFGEFMENKLGITYDNTKTNENAGFPSVVRPLTSFERKVLENKVENVYALFLERVSSNRKMSVEEVDRIGEGRIWSGTDALELGLVDKLGGLYDAVDLAAEIAGVEEYRLLELPVLKDPIEQMIEELSSGVYTGMIRNELGPFYHDYRHIRSVLQWEGVQARLPVQLHVE